MSDQARQAPVVSGNQVMAAGFAAAGASFVTSRFGVAGTLLGAALTAMIITGGSAILKAYLENVTGKVRKVPRKLRARMEERKADRYAETLPDRPDLRDNLAGRVRAALDWFLHLPPLTRRSILIKVLIAAAVAFVISMGTVFAVERGIGNSLSCGIWAKCPEGATPGIHLGQDRNNGANSTLSFGRAKTQTAPESPAYQRQNHVYQQNPQQNQPAPSYQQGEPGYKRPPSGSRNEPGGGLLTPERPVKGEEPAQQKPPSSASPAPGDEAPPAKKNPSSASPAPSQ